MTEHSGGGRGWEAVGRAVSERMRELRLSQAEVARLAMASTPTVRGLMRGEPRGDTSAVKRADISVALGWTADSIDLVYAGDKPRPAVTPLRRRATPDEMVEAIEELRRRVDRAENRITQELSLSEDQSARAQANVDLIEAVLDRLDAVESRLDRPTGDGASSAGD